MSTDTAITSQIFHSAMRDALKQSGLSRAQLAQRLGVRVNVISQTLRAPNLSVLTLTRFLAACGFELRAVILGEREGKVIFTPREG